MPTEDQGLQTQPQGQPQAQAVPDPAHVILSAAQTDDKTKADAWEIYHNHEGQEFESKLAASSLPQDAKSALWQSKTRAATTAQQPKVDADTSSVSDIVTHPLQSVARAADYYTRPDAKPAVQAEKPQANPAGAAPQLQGYGVPVPANLPSASKMPTMKMDYVNPTTGKNNTSLPAGATARPIPSLPTDEQINEFNRRGEKFGEKVGANVIPAADLLAETAGLGNGKPATEEQARAENPKLTGALEGVGGAVGGMATDPTMWALALTGGAELPVLSKVAQAAFSLSMGKDTLDGIKQLRADWSNLSEEERSKSIAKLGIQGLFAEEAARHLSTHLGENGKPTQATAEDKPIYQSEEQKQADSNVEALAKDRETAKKKLDTAQAKYNQHVASHEQGIESPKPVKNALDKAKAEHDEAIAHHELAQERVERLRTERRAQPTAAPAAPAESEITAKPKEEAPVLGKLGAPKAPPSVSPAHATTTIPQEPTEAPKVGYRTMQLPGGEPVGKQALLTEGTPEGPKVPEGGLPKINLPEEKPAPKPVTDEASLRALEAKKGVVTENTPKKVHELLKESLKPAEKYAGEERREVPRQAPKSAAEVEEAIKNRKPIQTPFDVTQGAMDTIKGDQNMPKHPAEQSAVAPKKEELVPVGEEGREPAKSAAEYHPAVQQKVGELTDTNLRTLAKAHGLNPDEYDFNARDEGRHRTDRDRLVKEVTDQIGEDEKINLGRAAESAEKEGLFQGADTSAGGRAKRAAKMFPRLRGPVDEFGNPKVSGGAPDEKDENTPRSIQARERTASKLYNGMQHLRKSGTDAEALQTLANARQDVLKRPEETVGTKEAADKDTEHFANAKKELGDKASISDVAKRAQELKDTHAQLAEHEKNGGSTFSSKGKNLNGTDKYSVGSYPDRTEKVDKLTPERLEEFKKKNADVLSKEDHAVGTWKDPDTGKAVLDVAKTYADRDEAISAGKAANQKSIYHLGGEGEIQTGGTGAVNDKGSPVDEFGNPTVSGGAPDKKLPTGDDLIKKYGESSGDPKDLTFILKDGRGVANTGIEHDHMLGGKTNEKVPPRERFIAEGNIRIRPRQGAGGREVSISIPENGVNTAQLKYIQKMSPQLRSGAVMIEVGKPGGGYKAIPYGEASPEQIETTVRGLGPVLNDKGSPIDWNGNPTVSGGSPAAGVAPAKEAALPELVEKHATPEEKASVTKSNVGTKNFLEQFEKVPPLQEWIDAAKGGEGARHWYQRSGKAFDALHEEAPNYFQEGDREKFGNFVAALSPRQMVHSNLREALHAWTTWVDDGRPTGDAMEKSLRDSITSAPDTKVPNAMKALNSEEMWPDLSKNRNFKVPSFGKNLNGYLNFSTNDGWQALFGGLDEKKVSSPSSYHPLSIMTRAAADALGWEPAEAQAAIWSFTQSLKEKGEVNPHEVRAYSEDFADIMAHNQEIRQQLKSLGVDLGKLDTKLEAIGEKPAITAGTSSTTEHSTQRLTERIEKARGEGSIPAPKTGNLFREAPAFEHKANPGAGHVKDESTRFNPEEFGNEEPSLNKLGKKKSPYGNVR